MSESDPIRIYVTHVFEASDDYLRVFEYLECVDKFYYINCSKPENVPGGSDKGFREEYLKQIRPAEVVVVLGSLFDKQRDWVQFQLRTAKAHKLPVITINAFGGTIITTQEMLDASDAVLDWNAREIVDSIRALARGENTQRWDVIDFP